MTVTPRPTGSEVPVLGPGEVDRLSDGFVQAGLQAGDLARPAVELGFLDAVADLDQPRGRRSNRSLGGFVGQVQGIDTRTMPLQVCPEITGQRANHVAE